MDPVFSGGMLAKCQPFLTKEQGVYRGPMSGYVTDPSGELLENIFPRSTSLGIPIQWVCGGAGAAAFKEASPGDSIKGCLLVQHG